MARVRASPKKGKGMRKKKQGAKQNTLETHEKIAVIKYHDANLPMEQKDLVAWIQKTYKCSYTQSAVSKILSKKSRAKLLSLPSQPEQSATRYRVRGRKHALVEKHLYEWVLSVQQRVELSGSHLKAKAAKFHELLLPEEDTAKHSANGWSDGWLANFKGAYKIKSHRRFGEAGSLDLDLIEAELPALKEKTGEYSREDIFNMDEFGLVIDVAVEKGLSTKQFSGTSKKKARATGAACSNATGTIKLPLWIIWKWKNHRDMRNVNRDTLGVVYRSNSKAWMTGHIFLQWLVWFDDQMEAKGRKVLLLMDNFSGHKAELEGSLKATEIYFLPPNTTSKLQPMDAGIIRALKAYYRAYYNDLLLEQLEDGVSNPGKIGIRRAITFLKDAWDRISQTTILNCWMHCNILGVHQEPMSPVLPPARVLQEPVTPVLPARDLPEDGGNENIESSEQEGIVISDDDDEEEDEEQEDEEEEEEVVETHAPVRLELSSTGEVIDQEAERELRESISRLNIHNPMSIDFLLNAPGENETAAPDTEEDIINMLKLTSTEPEPLLSAAETAKDIISHSAALKAAKLLSDYTDQQEGLTTEQASGARLRLKTLERLARSQMDNSMVQSKLTSFFSPLP
ncbi:hypothetical protein A4X09_0g6849 [Tilletia walkeri]|uniref:HTH CENPB-type domain-containing protein n=1 Tax=Tilletia walkeri TaxID=117179 RepID=A0A8X7T1I6_9BASI|nr:hypothetical protein A4X09_0g6849 [Tilletia walkeri]